MNYQRIDSEEALLMLIDHTNEALQAEPESVILDYKDARFMHIKEPEAYKDHKSN